MKQAIATVARFVVVQPCCRPLRRCRCWAIAGNSHCAPIVLPWRFPETFKKRFAARSVTKSKEFQLRAWLPKSSEKYRIFLIFMQKCVVLLSTIDVFRFLEPPGGPDDHMKSGWPKKGLKNFAFLILFLAAESVASKAEFRSRRFVCTGSEFFPKHIVLPAREDSFQLQEIIGGPPGGHGC